MAKLLLLRVAYLLAAAATAIMGSLAATGKFSDVMDQFASSSGELQGPPFPPAMVTSVNILMSVFLAALLALFVFLALRPSWWGKLICWGIGLTWIMGGAGFGIIAGFYPAVDCQLGAGAALILAGLLHQIVDPRFDSAGR